MRSDGGDFHVPGIVCQSCGETIDGAQAASTNAIDAGTAPRPGNVSLCFYCGALGIFDRHALGYMILRDPDDTERAELLADPEIVRAMSALQQFHEGHAASFTVETPPASADDVAHAVGSADVVVCFGHSVDVGQQGDRIATAIQARLFNMGGVDAGSIANALRALADSIEERPNT